MKVKELIGILEDIDEDALVILASDGEGNTYRELVAAEQRLYDGGLRTPYGGIDC